MKQIPLTQGKVALVDDEDYSTLSQHKWHYHKTGYARRNINRNGKFITEYMHRRVLDGKEIDHKDGNRLNNTRENLRVCTHSQNIANSKFVSRNTSGYRGVSKRGNAWDAHVVINGKQKSVGRFTDIRDAARAYNQAALSAYGDFAQLNPI